MPDARLARARATLPEGYQFGDAALDQKVFGALTPESRAVLTIWARHQRWSATHEQPWRSPSANAAEQLRAKAVWGDHVTANVIEGEAFGVDLGDGPSWSVVVPRVTRPDR